MTSKDKIDFFNGYWPFLEQRRIPNVILHNWENYPYSIVSDVDYCVPQASLVSVISHLADYCASCGWQIVQIFQHESTAYYCVCASNDNVNDVLLLDVCGDYMVHGKRRIPSDVLLINTREIKERSFKVLNASNELAYVLTKAILKKKDPSLVVKRMSELISELDDQYGDFCAALPLSEYFSIDQFLVSPVDYMKNSHWSSILLEERGYQLGEVKRLIKRIVSPSGFLLVVSNCGQDKNNTLSELACLLKGTYRAVKIVDSSESIVKSLWNTMVGVLKSNLVIKLVESGRSSLTDKIFGGMVLDLKNDDLGTQGGQLAEVALGVRSEMAERIKRRWSISC